jgi:flavin-dependent thymidylate synthase
MAQVKLFDFTGKGRPDEGRHAANLLVFSKSTRLNMSPGLFGEIQAHSDAKIQEELDYMAGTIPSSWEFVDLTFLITGMSRAAAQQLTRTRTASYAMQSQRVNDMSTSCVVNPFPHGSDEHDAFDEICESTIAGYGRLTEMNVKREDARGVLPLATECNLLAKYNLRSFAELVIARSSLRVQGEYADAVVQMKEEVLAVWPWAEAFFVPRQQRVIEMLEKVAREIGISTGQGPGWDIAKAVDLLRKG